MKTRIVRLLPHVAAFVASLTLMACGTGLDSETTQIGGGTTTPTGADGPNATTQAAASQTPAQEETRR